MARGDYRGCDVCDGKAFYDANLNYESGPDSYGRDETPYRVAGAPQYQDETMNVKHGMRLDYVGDWAVICADCSKKWKTQIVAVDA
jgi:hypothetical protein